MILRNLARDTLVYGGAEFFFKLLAFWTFPLIAAAISPMEFGALELALTATSLLGLIANCGLNNAVQRFYWDEETTEAQKPVLVSSGLAALCVFVLSAAIAGLLAVIVLSYAGKFPTIYIGWVGLLAAIVLMFSGQLVSYLLDVTRLHMRPWRFVAIALVSRVLTAVAGLVAVLWLATGVTGLLVAQALVMACTIPLALFAVRRDLTREIDLRSCRKLVQFGHPFIYAALAFWLFGSMDRWMLASMRSIDDVGIFSVAHRFASVILFVSMAFGLAWSPFSIKVRTDYPAVYREIYVDVLVALLCVMLPVGGGIALFAPELISILMPSEYQGAAVILSVLAVGLILQASMQVSSLGISLERRTYLFARLSWIAALLNLVLNLFLIPRLGALGAALATSVCYIYLSASYLYFTQRLHRLPLDRRLVWLLFVLLLIATLVWGLAMEHTFATDLVTRGGGMLLIVVLCSCIFPWNPTIKINRSSF